MESDSPSGLFVEGNPFGRVGYVHAGGIDAPLLVTREGMEDQTTPVGVVPHANWQGDFAYGTLLDGSWCGGVENPCLGIRWPGWRVNADGQPSGTGVGTWFGSVVNLRADGSRLQYLRNRYYDPASGQFTQIDPIGLAGGMNLCALAGR